MLDVFPTKNIIVKPSDAKTFANQVKSIIPIMIFVLQLFLNARLGFDSMNLNLDANVLKATITVIIRIHRLASNFASLINTTVTWTSSVILFDCHFNDCLCSVNLN